LHVLVVTPVIFFWIRSRGLPATDDVAIESEPRARIRPAVVVSLALVLAAAAAWWWWPSATTQTPTGSVLHETRAGGTVVRLRVPEGTQALEVGRNTFTLEFVSPDGAPITVRDLRLSVSMAMPGMVMTAPVQVAGQGHLWTATSEFSMAGGWRFVVEWLGPDGAATASFDGEVR
ncbi:MAG: FixH family protein, partial [Vicinamibacterales bacterium]